jgi:hypothetical protein
MTAAPKEMRSAGFGGVLAAGSGDRLGDGGATSPPYNYRQKTTSS